MDRYWIELDKIYYKSRYPNFDEEYEFVHLNEDFEENEPLSQQEAKSLKSYTNINIRSDTVNLEEDLSECSQSKIYETYDENDTNIKLEDAFNVTYGKLPVQLHTKLDSIKEVTESDQLNSVPLKKHMSC